MSINTISIRLIRMIEAAFEIFTQIINSLSLKKFVEIK